MFWLRQARQAQQSFPEINVAWKDAAGVLKNYQFLEILGYDSDSYYLLFNDFPKKEVHHYIYKFDRKTYKIEGYSDITELYEKNEKGKDSGIAIREIAMINGRLAVFFYRYDEDAKIVTLYAENLSPKMLTGDTQTRVNLGQFPAETVWGFDIIHDYKNDLFAVIGASEGKEKVSVFYDDFSVFWEKNISPSFGKDRYYELRNPYYFDTDGNLIYLSRANVPGKRIWDVISYHRFTSITKNGTDIYDIELDISGKYTERLALQVKTLEQVFIGGLYRESHEEKECQGLFVQTINAKGHQLSKSEFYPYTDELLNDIKTRALKHGQKGDRDQDKFYVFDFKFLSDSSTMVILRKLWYNADGGVFVDEDILVYGIDEALGLMWTTRIPKKHVYSSGTNSERYSKLFIFMSSDKLYVAFLDTKSNLNEFFDLAGTPPFGADKSVFTLAEVDNDGDLRRIHWYDPYLEHKMYMYPGSAYPVGDGKYLIYGISEDEGYPSHLGFLYLKE